MIPMLKDPSASINDVNEWPACLVVLMACHCMQNVVWEITMHPTVDTFRFKWPGLCFVILSCSLVTLTRPVTEVWPDLACWNDGWCMLMFYNLNRCLTNDCAFSYSYWIQPLLHHHINEAYCSSPHKWISNVLTCIWDIVDCIARL